jgi:hypothetical protein
MPSPNPLCCRIALLGFLDVQFTHHLELRSTADIDDDLRFWLQEAWAAAG